MYPVTFCPCCFHVCAQIGVNKTNESKIYESPCCKRETGPREHLLCVKQLNCGGHGGIVAFILGEEQASKGGGKKPGHPSFLGTFSISKEGAKEILSSFAFLGIHFLFQKKEI